MNGLTQLAPGFPIGFNPSRLPNQWKTGGRKKEMGSGTTGTWRNGTSGHWLFLVVYRSRRRHSASKRGWAEGGRRWSGRGIVEEERHMVHKRVFLIGRHIALHRFPAMKPSDIRLQNGRHDMYDSILLLVHNMSSVMKTLSPPPVPPHLGGTGGGKKKRSQKF